jgi:MoaA/NifB/PqqE/SkfB family radical SAM enzyme
VAEKQTAQKFSASQLEPLCNQVPHPLRVNIEISGSCNLQCIMCRGSSNYTERSLPGKFMGADEFRTLLGNLDLNRLVAVNLAGAAEPLLNPQACEIIDICKESGLTIFLITNGTLLTQQVAQHLVGWRGKINISWGGAHKETFESIRRGANMDQVVENIRYLTELKIINHAQYPEIWLNPILMLRNLVEMPAVVELAHELGCTGVAASHLIVDSMELVGESLFLQKQLSNYWLRQTQETAEKLGIKTVLPGLFDLSGRAQDPPSWQSCLALWENAIIGLKNLIPCSSIRRVPDAGDYLHKSFMETWNNAWYAEARRGILTGNPCKECRECHSPGLNVNNPYTYFSSSIMDQAGAEILSLADQGRTGAASR